MLLIKGSFCSFKIANIPPEGGRKHPEQPLIKIDTTNILFICGGTFDGIGKNFLEQLKLKRGVTAFLSRILFGTILKVIKFFFLDNVVEELSKKDSDITSSDIEHAVRRVGVEMVTAPILEKFLYLQIINFILFILIFGVPIGILILF